VPVDSRTNPPQVGVGDYESGQKETTALAWIVRRRRRRRRIQMMMMMMWRGRSQKFLVVSLVLVLQLVGT